MPVNSTETPPVPIIRDALVSLMTDSDSTNRPFFTKSFAKKIYLINYEFGFCRKFYRNLTFSAVCRETRSEKPSYFVKQDFRSKLRRWFISFNFVLDNKRMFV